MGKVDVFDAQTKDFHETQAAAVHDLCHEAVVALHVGDDGLNFVFGKDGGDISPFAGATVGKVFASNFDVEDVVIEEEEGGESLILSGGGDVFVIGEVGEVGVDLICAHVFGMAFVVVEDVFARGRI